MTSSTESTWLNTRFRGYLPVVVDIETGGFNDKTDAILQIGACILAADTNNKLSIASSHFYEVAPFEGANLEKSALQFTGIAPYAEDRNDVAEATALKDFFKVVRDAVKAAGCKKAILVGHNAFFDLGFVNAGIERCNIKRVPFHPFSTLDTVSLGALFYQQTVLAKCCAQANIEFSNEAAHNAGYDAEKTAELFCKMINEFPMHG